MSVAARVRMGGPLTPFRKSFAAEMTARGYTDLSLANQLRVMADLSRWLDAGGIALDHVDDEVLSRFLKKRRRRHTHFISRAAIDPLVSHLTAIGAIAFTVRTPCPRREELVAYERYLVDERGVAPARQALCLRVAEEFLGTRRVSTLAAADVTRFVAQSVESDKLSALRSILRFLFVSSRIEANLVYAVPSSPRWTQRSLPQGLESAEVQAVLETCDRRTLVGSRDYAVLLSMVRLGLRACEVAALQLEDLDWRAGELIVHGKGRSLGRLPLPCDVGDAIARYLKRARRNKATRTVFVRCRAPYTSMTSSGVVAIVRQALRGAGVVRGGAHRLRHTAATQMLRRGASLTEIAQVLRHRHVNTTAIYAKVDRDALRTLARKWPDNRPSTIRDLARPWPGGVA
jgi:site-specific recombinase XerD